MNPFSILAIIGIILMPFLNIFLCYKKYKINVYMKIILYFFYTIGSFFINIFIGLLWAGIMVQIFGRSEEDTSTLSNMFLSLTVLPFGLSFGFFFAKTLCHYTKGTNFWIPWFQFSSYGILIWFGLFGTGIWNWVTGN